MTNFTGNENHKTFDELFCSEEFTSGIHNQLICLLVLTIFLSTTAFLGNTLILVALHKETSLHMASKILYRCLATTDICVGLIAEPLIIIYWISVVNKCWSICRVTLVISFLAGFVLCSVSLLTMTAISVDRLLALLLGLRYRQVVTVKRTYITVAAFWLIAFVGSTLLFYDYRITLFYGYTGILSCVVTSVFSYTKIFVTLHQYQNQVQILVQDQPSQAIPLNIARYRKAVSSALMVQSTLVVCYLPHGIVGVIKNNSGLSSSVYLARQVSVALVYLNSSLNPILYCWKIREVRLAVKDSVRHFLCSSS